MYRGLKKKRESYLLHGQIMIEQGGMVLNSIVRALDNMSGRNSLLGWW